jgi:hypothetical protein
MVSAWCSWTSSHGFDFVAIGTHDGDVLLAEVYYMESLSCVYHCQHGIVSLSYLKERSDIVAVSEGGTVVVIPFDST